MPRALVRIALIITGLFLLVFAAFVLLLQTPLATSFLENRLRAWVHPALQLNGPAQMSILPELGLDLRNITIPGPDASQPMLAIEQLQVQMPWLPLFDQRLVIDQLYIQGLDVFQVGVSTSASIPGPSESSPFDAHAIGQWVQDKWRGDSRWHVVLREVLAQDLVVLATDGETGQLPLVSLQQVEFRSDISWPTVVGGGASLGLRHLSVNDADEFGYTPALLEQLGIATNGQWDLIAFDSQWQVREPGTNQATSQQINLLSLSANGAWGELSADAGSINVDTGQVAIPMRAILTNAPRFKSRAVEINVRRSKMQFELTGTLAEPGVQWLTPKP